MTTLMLSAKPMLRIFILVCGIFIFSQPEAKATHIVGGDLTYQCLGNGFYRFRLTVRRDCLQGAADAPFDNPAAIGLYDLTTGMAITDPVRFPFGEIRIAYNASDTLNEQLMSDCSVVTGPVCVETFVYDTTLFLPARPTGYIFVYQRCCRNGSINNIINPLETGMSLVAELTGAAQSECNSSPQFGDFPPVYACVNREIVFDHSAIDLEGDSLVYELCTPFAGGSIPNAQPHSPMTGPPYNTVVYRPPYSLSNLMGGVPLQIDPNTGLLTGTPNTIGQFVVGICVTAYRNGVMTGKTRRDFQFNVRQCRDVPTPAFFAPSLDCEDLAVTFDNQSLLADEYLWIFDLEDSNSVTSTEFEPTFTYPEGGCYDVALVVNVLEGNQRFCIDTVVHEVCVFDSQIAADFTFDVSACTEEIILELNDNSNDPDPNHDIVGWEWLITYDSNVLSSTLPNPQFPLNVDGSATVLAVLVVTSSNGCTATQVHSFPVNQISVPVDPNSAHLCDGDTTGLLLGADCTLTYIWEPTDFLIFPGGLMCNPLANPGESITYNVTVTDGLCEVTASIPVVVQELPALAFTHDTDCKTLQVTFNNTGEGDNFFWDFDDGDTSLLDSPVHIFPDTGSYTVTLESRDGCDVSISQEIHVNAITEDLEDTRINCFQDSIALNPVNNPGYIYVWSPAEFLNNPNLPNPNAGVPDDTKFYVTIYSPGLEGCPITDSLTVIVPDDFTVSAGPDTTRCDFDEIVITAISNGDVTFEWFNSDNVLISDEAVVSITTFVTDTFRVTATDSLGCSKSDFVIVTRVNDLFGVDAPPDTAYCGIQAITLTGSASIPGVTFQWVNVAGDTISDSAVLQVIPEEVNTCYLLIGTEIASGCQAQESVCVSPTVFDLSISDGQGICLDEVVPIIVTDHLGQPLSFLWSPLESIDSLASGNSVAFVSPSETTLYTVTVTNDVVGCTATLTSEVVVNLFNPFTVVITADPTEPFLTETTQLTVNQPSGFGYVWSASNGEIIPGIFNPVVTPSLPSTTYTVTVTNEEGCTQVATLTVSVKDPLCNEEDIFLPNAFTPNDDGVNDILYVRSNFVSELELHIYNRWGQEVFSTTDINIGWDGKFNGKRLAPDVYGYYMQVGCPNQKTYFEKGNITLLE